MSAMPEFKITCESCGQHVRYEQTEGGGALPCPNCSVVINLPEVIAIRESEPPRPRIRFHKLTWLYLNLAFLTIALLLLTLLVMEFL